MESSLSRRLAAPVLVALAISTASPAYAVSQMGEVCFTQKGVFLASFSGNLWFKHPEGQREAKDEISSPYMAINQSECWPFFDYHTKIDLYVGVMLGYGQSCNFALIGKSGRQDVEISGTTLNSTLRCPP